MIFSYFEKQKTKNKIKKHKTNQKPKLSEILNFGQFFLSYNYFIFVCFDFFMF